MNTSHDFLKLGGARVAITGGGSGIGLATARLLANAGAEVIVLDRDANSAAEAIETIGSGSWQQLDVTNEGDVERIVSAQGPLDALVNCAGIAIRRPAIEHGLADWNAVMAANVTGSFLCARSAARAMISAKRHGSIVHTASIMGLSGGGVYPNISYQTAKGALVNMTRALAVEWAPHQIRVNAVAPTYVRTPFIKALTDQPEVMARIVAMTPLGRLAEADEVAAAIAFLCSPASAMITGHTLPIDGGFLAQ